MGPLKFEFRRPSLTASGEVGSLAELVGILQDEGSALVKMFGDDMELVVQSVSGASEGAAPAAAQEGTAEPAKRGRKAKGADPATATAPPPAPVPAAAPPSPPAPLNTTENANGIPAFLDRTATGSLPPPSPAALAAAAPPPPPLLPAAPPVAPAAPVSGPVGLKIIEIITAKTAGAADGGQSYADWLATAGVTIKGATLAEAISVLRMTTDDKLSGVAQALGV